MTDDQVIEAAVDATAEVMEGVMQAIKVLAGVIVATPQPDPANLMVPLVAWEAFAAALIRIGDRATSEMARLEAEL